MLTLPPNPVVYEINSWVWLADLSRRYGRPITLASVPAPVWDELAALGLDAVWLMGVWERSPAGVALALANPDLMERFRTALPDLGDADIVGSPYCIRRYEVAAELGGRSGLAAARAALAERGIGLLLDFVPNHVAPDHPWTIQHPGYFIQGDSADLERAPDEFLRVGHHVLARGRDPYFAPWPDVAQLNLFDSGLRAALASTMREIADQCDGVRCDMAMLVLNRIFAQTWGERAGPPPEAEIWPELIAAVKTVHPGFTWVAEAYWDMEWDLQQLGFAFCYDKRLYDRLAHENAAAVDGHLHAEPAYQARLVRFVENHDEARAASTFPPGRHRVAALAAGTQLGMRLFHEGQLDGRRVHVPVFLGRRPDETPDYELQRFYRRLLGALRLPVMRLGSWRLCSLSGWPDNQTHRNLVAWGWAHGEQWCLVAVNVSERPAQARVKLDWPGLRGRRWYLRDQLDDARYEREGDVLVAEGLYVDLQAWGMHLFVTE